MRLVRFNRHVEAPSLARLGVVLRNESVADLRAGYASYLSARGEPQALDIAAVRVPATISALIAAGVLALPELRDVVEWLEGLAASEPHMQGARGEAMFTPLRDCRLHAPVRLTNLFIAGRRSGSSTPSFSMKPSIAVVGPARDIRLPTNVSALTCAPGVAVVIGRTCRDLDPGEADDVIAGYFVMTNVSVATPAFGEHFEDGMHETFAPSGPWLVTADEVRDPMNLAVEMRVNGESRRRFSTSEMTSSIPRLVASLSRASLQAGDVIWCDAHDARLKDATVHAGDEVESIVDGVGMIRNRVIG